MEKHIYIILILFSIITGCKKDLEFDKNSNLNFVQQKINPSPSYGIIYECLILNPNKEKFIEQGVLVTRNYKPYEENGEIIPIKTFNNIYTLKTKYINHFDQEGNIEIGNDFDIGVECSITPWVKTPIFTYYGPTTYFIPVSYKKPIIDHILPHSGNNTGTITINGHYFSENNERNIIYLSGKKITTASSSSTQIIAKYYEIEPGTYDITIKLGEKEFILEKAYTVQ